MSVELKCTPLSTVDWRFEFANRVSWVNNRVFAGGECGVVELVFRYIPFGHSGGPLEPAPVIGGEFIGTGVALASERALP